MWHRERYRRAAVSAVFEAAADLVAAAPGAEAEARHRLALASAAARQAGAGYRLRPVVSPLHAAWSAARDAAAAAAEKSVARPPEDVGTSVDPAAGAAPNPAPPGAAEVGRAWRARAREVRTGDLRRFPAVPPVPPRPLRSVLRRATSTAALWVGARIGLCVGLATTLAILLHPPQHAFWIPLTVAVVLRPEYGAVLVRAVQRFLGTAVGVVAVALLVTLTSTPWWLALAAALALGGAAFAAPRLYGLAVVGITGSALLSIAVADPQGVQVWARLLDTALGCALAFVVGVLLWPRRGLPDQSRVFASGRAALIRQIRAVDGGPDTEEAYRVAHDWRAELERGLAEPDPAHAAAAWLPVAIQLEHAVDAVAATDGDRAVLLALLADPAPVPTPAQASRLLARVVAALPYRETLQRNRFCGSYAALTARSRARVASSKAPRASAGRPSGRAVKL